MSFGATQNLEVPGSSPGWSTSENKALTNFSQVPFFMFGEQRGNSNLLNATKSKVTKSIQIAYDFNFR